MLITVLGFLMWVWIGHDQSPKHIQISMESQAQNIRGRNENCRVLVDLLNQTDTYSVNPCSLLGNSTRDSMTLTRVIQILAYPNVYGERHFPLLAHIHPSIFPANRITIAWVLWFQGLGYTLGS